MRRMLENLWLLVGLILVTCVSRFMRLKGGLWLFLGGLSSWLGLLPCMWVILTWVLR